MKKLLCLLLTLAMTLSFAACGSKADDKTPEEDDPTQAETNIADKQDEPAADDVDKDDASDATEIEPDANKGEKPDEAQKPAEPTKSDSKKDETPASKPSEPAKPAEPSKPAETPSETPSETPAAQDTGALSLLTSVWSTYSEDDKFPAAGGDAEHSVDDAPGSFDVSNADNLTYQLTFPSADVSLIDGAASLVHMMNLNTFTCGAFHVSDAGNVSTVAADIRSAVQGKQWMCGFPDKLVVITMGQFVVSVYGAEDLVDTFRDKLQNCFSSAAVVYDEPIA